MLFKPGFQEKWPTQIGALVTDYTEGIGASFGAEEISVEELPAHTHWSNGARFSGSGWYSEYYVYAQDIGCTCNSTGGSAAHNNMPPYEIVYAWMKVA